MRSSRDNHATSLAPRRDESPCGQCAKGLRVHAETTRILAAHMTAVIERTQAAAAELVTHMTRTHEEVQSIVRTLKAATAESHRQYDGGPEGVATLHGCIEQRSRDVATERDRLVLVAKRANEMKTLLAGMSDFAISAKVLAINARVEASRAGEHGRAFGVVAEEMSRVADTTKTAANDLGDRAATIAQTMKSALDSHVIDAQKAQAEERVALDAVAEGLNRLTAALVHKNAFLDDLEARATALSRTSMDGLAGVQFQDIVRQRLEMVLGVLAELDAHVANVVAYAEGDHQIDVIGGAERLGAMVLEDRYVMRAQREDHASAMGVSMSKEVDGPDIELF